MRIGFNGRYVQKTLSGIEYYLLNLVSGLSEIDRSNEYFIFLNRQAFTDESARSHLDKTGVNIRVSDRFSGSRLSRLSWDYATLGRDLNREKIDLFHGPSFSVPLVKTCPSVVTIHDMAFRHTPESYTRLNRYYFKVLLPLVVKKVAAIITDSQSSKRDIVNLLSVPEEKVSVVYPGVSPEFRDIRGDESGDRVRCKYKTGKSFIFNVSGLITPRKNLDTLIKAYARLKDTGLIDRKLVIVGRAAWNYGGVFDLVSRLRLDNDVIFTGSVPKEDLVELYNSADLSVFPSLYEGFGFPVIESMSCGTPVVCSNTSSLPELAGEACRLVDPTDDEGLSEAISEILSDTDLRDDMSRRGLVRAKGFDWKETAKRTLEVYRQAVAHE